MHLDIFIKHQESNEALMCINQEHIMPLIAVKNLDDEIELKCFTGECDYKYKPGLAFYENLLKKYE